MKRIDLIKTNCTSWVKSILVIVLGFYLASCANNSPLVPEAEYSTKIVGRWQGPVGDLKETMSIDGDGTFICQVHRMGFIANTLSQRVTGTIRGTWKITGAIIILRITDAKNERLGNRIASSTIVAFKKNELVLKSDHGETSTFQRVFILWPKAFMKTNAEALRYTNVVSPKKHGFLSRIYMKEKP